MDNIVFNQEKYLVCITELEALAKKHSTEIDLYPDKVPVSVDHMTYMNMESAGILKIYTARKDNKLIAYNVFHVMPHIHYKTTKYAMSDALYLDPAYRGQGLARPFFQFCEKKLKEEEGVQVITMTMKQKYPFDKLCEAEGFDYAERVYSKYIGE